MGTFVYTPITYLLATGALDLSSADIRVKVLMSNTTAGDEEDADSLSAITTLDEYDGSGYSELDLASITVTEQDTDDRTETTAADGSFGSTVAAGTRSGTALLFYVYIDGTAANDYPLVYDSSPSQFPFTGDGGPMSVGIDPTGFLHIAA